MQGQDWEPVILKKHNITSIQPKENEPAVREMTVQLQKAIQQARLNAKMSQMDLAKLLNVHHTIIIDYENGKAIPNNFFITKIEKALNIKLPRAPKKNKEDI